MSRRIAHWLGTRFYRAIVALTAMIVLVSSVGVDSVFADNNSSNNPSLYDFYSQNGVLFYSANTTGCSNAGSGESSSKSENTGSYGSFLTKGTPTNKVAQQIVDYFQALGFSGAGIAGILSNVYAESGFVPTIAQGGGDLSVGAVPQGGGGGLFQFTPYTKYAPLGSAAWKDVDGQLNKATSLEPQSFLAVANSTDAGDAGNTFEKTYERPAVVLDRSEPGVTAYNATGVFTTDLKSISSDASKQAKLGSANTSGGGSSVSSSSCTGSNVTTGSVSVDNAIKELMDTCSDSGTIPSLPTSPGQEVHIKDISSCTVSIYGASGNQCVALVQEYLGRNVPGNGKDTARNSGLAISTVPVAGGIFSAINNSAMDATDSVAGHTGIVIQVNSDGSIITAENGTGFPGLVFVYHKASDYAQNTTFTVAKK